MQRLLPHPYLTLVLTLFWLLLAGSLDLGNLLLGLFLAILIAKGTSAYWPNRPKISSLTLLFRYILLVVWDVLVANIQVARIILFMPAERIQSAWITVPLDLHAPEAIALLSGTITMTPGTLTADIAADGRSLLIHALHAPDPDAVCRDIKQRYEDRLKRIFP